MTNPPSRRFLPLSGLLLAVLAGCNVVPPPQDDPTRFYVLSEQASHDVRPAATGGVRIALRAVRLEGYLRRREVVVRTGPNEVEFRDYHRWAEPLDAAVGRVLRQDLLASSAFAQVYTDPFPVDAQPDYSVDVDVTRCEGGTDAQGRSSAIFTAVVEVAAGGSGGHVVSRKVFTAPAQAWDGRDYDKLAGILSTDVAALAADIAASLPPQGT